MTLQTKHESVNPRWLAAFRIGIGLVLAASFISLWPDFDRLYTSGHRALADNGLLDALYPDLPLSVQVGLEGWVVYIGYPLLCLFVAAGLFTRPSALLLLALHGFLFLDRPYFSYGFDYLASSMLLYCVVFPVHRYRSLDRLIFRPRSRGYTTPYLRCLQLHACMMYFFAGAGKGAGHTWHNGEALWKALQQPGFANPLRDVMDGLAAYPYLWVAAGWTVIVLEMGYPLFIWLRPTRRPWLCGVIGLHIGIALLLGLYAFSALLVVINLAAFYYPYRINQSATKQIGIHPMVSPAHPSTSIGGTPQREEAMKTRKGSGNV